MLQVPRADARIEAPWKHRAITTLGTKPRRDGLLPLSGEGMPDMHIILGGTGRVGSAVAHALLKRCEHVTVVSRDAVHATDMKAAGAEIAVANVRDVAAMREIAEAGWHRRRQT